MLTFELCLVHKTDKAKPAERRARKATGPRFLREAMEDLPKDPKTPMPKPPLLAVCSAVGPGNNVPRIPQGQKISAAISSRIRLSAKIPICFAALFLTGGTSGATAESDSGHAFTTTETVQPIFDDRVWKLGHTAAQGDQTVWEYVLSGETVENWTELITVQSFTGSLGSTAPVEALRRVRDLTLHDCPDAMWSVIRESETEVLFEWREEGCQGPVDSDDQYGISRIIKGSLGLHIVSYGNKRQPHLPETERSEWIDRLSQAELIVRVGVADNAKRSYPLMPTRAFVIDGGSVAIQAGVSGDPVRPSLPFGKMKYPARYFVKLFNEADRTVWAQIHWYFPHKRKDKVKQKSGPVEELDAGESIFMSWSKFGIVADKDHPLKIIISTDKKQKNILQTEETHMYFAAADVDVFKERFDDFVSQGGGGLPLINGWQEMPNPKRDIPGTATDANLQGDIQYSLWKEESKQYRDCNHDTLRAESADEKVSTVVVSSMSETGERNEPVPKSQTVLREFWWVRSCDVTSKYEVLLAESSDGAAEMTVTKIGETN